MRRLTSKHRNEVSCESLDRSGANHLPGHASTKFPGNRRAISAFGYYTTRKMTRTGIFDKAFYINLDRSEDRREYVENQFRKQHLEVERFPAIDARKLDRGRLIDDGAMAADVTLNLGSTACLLSHLALWEHILDNESGEIFLIFEDDAEPARGFIRKLNRRYGRVPKDWDMIRVGHNDKLSGTDVNRSILSPMNNPRRGNAEQHCYLIKKPSIPKLRDILFPIRESISKDKMLRQNFDRFNAYFVKRPLACQKEAFDSIRLEDRPGSNCERFRQALTRCFVDRRRSGAVFTPRALPNRVGRRGEKEHG